MKKHILSLLALCAILPMPLRAKDTAAAAKNTPTAAPATTPAGKWKLVELNGKAELVTPGQTLTLDPEKKTMSCLLGVNEYSNRYEQEDDKLKFGNEGKLTMARQSASERAFLAALDTTDHWRITNGKLALLQGDKIVASFVKDAVAAAAEELDKVSKDVLDAGNKDVPKIEVTDSMIGYRDTLRFYIFEPDRAVLCVRIDNKDTKFPVSAKLYTFAEGVNAEAVGTWINNQHSDGLFADAPEPKATHEIPAASCKMKSHELAKQSQAPNGKFDTYSVTFEIKDVPRLGELKVKDFTDRATVRIKTE